MSAWIENLCMALEHKSVVILHGNVRDSYIDGNGGVYDKLTTVLTDVSGRIGCDFDERRFLVPSGEVRTERVRPDVAPRRAARSELGGGSGEYQAAPRESGEPETGDARVPCGRRIAEWADLVKQSSRRCFFVVHYLDKIAPFKSSYSSEELQTLYLLEKMIENITLDHRLILVALSDSMIPVELSTQSPKCRVIPIPQPDKPDRVGYLQKRLGEHRQLEMMADITDGLHLMDLDGICGSVQEAPDLSAREIRAIVNRHRLGIQEDYWGSLSIERLSKAHEWFVEEEGVIGQDQAVARTCDVLCRARAGLSGMASGTASKPKGVLFFAGPPGVGKTLLAKKSAKFLFGTEEAFVRIDMSELKDEHSMSKLIGSPPGYVGHERGGMLTNAVRQRPFSVVLFDEIEKANPAILDVFLQLLDEGRLTDSRGQTVFFTETLIIFTSNIGNREQDKARLQEQVAELYHAGERHRAEYERLVQDHFVSSVEHYFESEISRPELLRRIGSIVPFRPIRNEDVQRLIIDSHLARIREDFEDRFRHRGFRLEFAQPEVSDFLVAHSREESDLESEAAAPRGSSTRRRNLSRFGGGGLTLVIELYLVDELSRPVLRAEHEDRRNVCFGIRAVGDRLVVDDGSPQRDMRRLIGHYQLHQ